MIPFLRDRRDLQALVPIAAVATVFTVQGEFYLRFEVVSESLKLPELTWQGTRDFGLTVHDFLARFSLCLASAALALGWLCAVGLSVDAVLRSTARRPAWLRWGTIAAPALFTVVMIFAILGLGREHRIYVPPRLLEDLLEKFSAATGAVEVTALNHLATALLISAVTFLTLAVAALLLPRGAGEPEDLRRRYRRLDLLLYAGAALLAIGVLYTRILLRWPIPFLAGEEAEGLARLADGYTALAGVYWSLVLVALYVPAALLLRRKARALARGAPELESDRERDEWLEREELAPSYAERLYRLAAVLGPFLAGGPVSALIGQLIG